MTSKEGGHTCPVLHRAKCRLRQPRPEKVQPAAVKVADVTDFEPDVSGAMVFYLTAKKA